MENTIGTLMEQMHAVVYEKFRFEFQQNLIVYAPFGYFGRQSSNSRTQFKFFYFILLYFYINFYINSIYLPKFSTRNYMIFYYRNFVSQKFHRRKHDTVFSMLQIFVFSPFFNMVSESSSQFGTLFHPMFASCVHIKTMFVHVSERELFR